MGVCTALNLNDSSKCTATATNKTGLFCELHARQVQGLYQGYKRRSEDLDALEKKQPKSLPKSLGSADFSTINAPETLTVLHAYLLRKFNLTTRCVMARDYHHSHFYKDTSDFGHQVYLDRLRSARILLVQALHRLEKRMLDVTYHKAQWYAWVESLQTEADSRSEVEKKKVKAEAALFKKHQINVNKLREEEEARQRDDLEKVEVWDPIESIIENSRAGYIALIRVMILADGTTQDEMMLAIKRGMELQTNSRTNIDTFELENSRRSRNRKALRIGPDRQKYQEAEEENMKVTGKKNRKATVESDDEAEEERRFTPKATVGSGDEASDDTDGAIATALTDLRIVDGSSPTGSKKTLDEKELLRQIKVISEFVLLRLIIANPSLLTTAMASPSIDAFLNNTVSVRNTDLRDLGLDLSRPSLKLMKSACLDYWVDEVMKGQDGGSQALVKAEMEKEGQPTTGTLPEKLKPERLALWRENRINVCGKWVYNPPPEFTLPRDGWSQFSILMTNCSLWDAISLCNSWNEFFDLNIFILNGYFSHWASPHESESLKHLRRLGLVSYAASSNAASATGYTQVGGRASGRAHKATEARNYLCANISRDEPGTWRFVNLIQTYKSRLVCYVKDCLTGQVICAPPDEEKWLIREKEGLGRMSRGKWVVRESFDRTFRAKIEGVRPWKLQFNGYLDIVVWHRHAGWQLEGLFVFLTEIMHKAYKYKDNISIMQPTFDVFHRASMGTKNSLIIEHIKKKIENHPKKDKGGPKVFPKMFYNSIDEEIDKDYAPYDGRPRSGKEPGGDGIDEEGEEEGEEEEEEEDDGEEEGEVWQTAQYEAKDLVKAVGYVVKEFMNQIGEPILDFRELRRTHKGYDKGLKFLEEVSNSRKTLSAKTKFDGIQYQKDLISMWHGHDPYSRRVAQILTDMLWGDNKEMEKGFRAYIESVDMLQDVETRAKSPPPRRPAVCPDNVYAEWDKLKKESSSSSVNFPKEHERAILRTLMKLWKQNIIKPSWSMDRHVLFAGRAHKDGDYHMYVDYRHLVQKRLLRPPNEFDPMIEAPPGIRYLRDEMEKFENENHGATYSLIRVESEPEYWHAIMSYEDAQRTAIEDPLGRIWEWTKPPKDMPFCEWTPHGILRVVLSDSSSDGEIGAIEVNVKSRIDTVLVMGKDEHTCRVWTAEAITLITTKPHGFDIDFARSFLKVDAPFLRRLPEIWWE